MKLGWIGTGVMGTSMAGHLQAAGHEVYVFNRTRQKAERLLAQGAVWCATPAKVAQNAEVVFTIVGFPADVEEVYLGAQGILSVKGACRIVVDMTTSEPGLARKIAQAAAEKGIASLDAPVSGGDVGAKNGTLAIMVGGEKSAFDEVRPLFQCMGKNIALMGEAGSGQHTKMCNQILIAGNMIGVCESLLYAEKVGLDQQAVIDIIGQGAASSWSINNLGPRVVKGNYDPGFFVEHFIKDMGIALKEAAAVKLSLPGLALVHQLYIALQAQGHGRSGTQALMLALKTLNGEK
ncbi:NAD binding domain of 6-phosphogluconate dehydrogenase [Candidatus Vecturithrix granuli]|uniref:NAD binding domain of 6-phosphogluconate dehydrogenase n=1 Tax=Vecturithrix granuli TaxID=1499967 RepID=A0A081C9F9_VECG1|nr:NAD binding domain of 6-phosphogluconate dehydrogenase [Candidatus Vecturithrix granuli]